MRKTLISSSIAMCLGVAGTADALTMNMTQLVFGITNPSTGTLNSSGGGTFNSLTPFFGAHWTANGVAFFSATGGHVWEYTRGPVDNINNTNSIGTFSYNFSLTDSQVAWGVFWDWNGNNDIAVLNIMDCASLTPGASCVAVHTPVHTAPFYGAQAPAWSGTISVVPIPAAAWLFGLGLTGLAVLTRRKKSA